MNNSIKFLINEINNMANKFHQEIKIMEVCGTHTQMISKLGLRSILSKNIKLISGPGCPVCVTGEYYIDTVVEIMNQYDVIVTSFGDLLKVKGTKESLLNEKSKGKDVRIIHSPLDLIELAESEQERNIIFLAVCFETTAPIIALTIKTAFGKGINNLFCLTDIKLMPPILNYIFIQPENKIQGLICPGHVATIKGANYFKFLTDVYNIPAAICGFETLDILKGIYYLVKQITKYENGFINLYKRCVSHIGNVIANQLIEEVFQISDGEWRGIGSVNNSSLEINNKFANFDAREKFKVQISKSNQNLNCLCGDILLGKKNPFECKFFDNKCNPSNPIGPCMVSTEGACAIAYKHKGDFIDE